MEVINLPYRSAILIWRVVSFQFTILNAFKFTLGALVQFQPVRLSMMTINYDMHYPSLAKLLGFFSTAI
nr:MAG TPA: hypothetical protein [Caudoviricetes sp.]